MCSCGLEIFLVFYIGKSSKFMQMIGSRLGQGYLKWILVCPLSIAVDLKLGSHSQMDALTFFKA